MAALRSKMHILLDAERLAEEERKEPQRAIVAELGELAQRVSDVLPPARGSMPAERVESVELHEIARDAVDRARRRAPALRFELDIEPAVILNSPGAGVQGGPQRHRQCAYLERRGRRDRPPTPRVGTRPGHRQPGYGGPRRVRDRRQRSRRRRSPTDLIRTSPKGPDAQARICANRPSRGPDTKLSTRRSSTVAETSGAGDAGVRVLGIEYHEVASASPQRFGSPTNESRQRGVPKLLRRRSRARPAPAIPSSDVRERESGCLRDPDEERTARVVRDGLPGPRSRLPHASPDPWPSDARRSGSGDRPVCEVLTSQGVAARSRELGPRQSPSFDCEPCAFWGELAQVRVPAGST
jgi:hypothetical protein